MEEIKLRKKIVRVGGTTDGIRLTKNEGELYNLEKEDVVEVIINILKKGNDKTPKKQ